MINIGTNAAAFWLGVVLSVACFSKIAPAAPPGLLILERAAADLDFFQTEFQNILRSVGPTPEGQRVQTLIEKIKGLKREIWLAKKLLLIAEAVTAEKDQAKVQFMIKQNFAEIIAHVQETIEQIKLILKGMQPQNLIRSQQELIDFLEAYIEGLEYIQASL